MISHEHRCIFVHIPRNAGSSIEDLLWTGERRESELWGFTNRFGNKYQNGGLQHLLARQIKTEVGSEVFKKYFKFSFVRNPWDKIASQYTYTLKNRADLREFLGISAGATMREYLAAIYSRKHVHWELQHEFLFGDEGELLVDFVGRYENLQSDFDRVTEKLSLNPMVLKRTNASQDRPYRQYFDKDSRQLVGEIYRKDLEAFEYEF